MDRRTVLTKTAKGLMEVTGKTSLLSREQRNVLSQVDGKATVGDIHQRLDKFSEHKLLDMLAKLSRDGFAREFVSAPTSISPPSQVPIVHEGPELDFSNVASSPPRAMQAAAERAEADEVARQVAAARAKSEADAKAAEAHARREAEQRAERKRREEEERLRREREDEERIRRELEDRIRIAEEAAQREAEARRRREAEERARREAEERARQEAEERARQEAEERARREAEERAWREAEERAQQEAEKRARREVAERAEHEAQEKVRRAAEEQERAEAAKRAREEEKARAKAEAEAAARTRREERAREKAEAEERTQVRAREEEKTRAEVAARLEAIKSGRAGRLKRLLATGAVAALVAAVVVAQFLPLDTAFYERLATRKLGTPVKIGGGELSILPSPKVKFRDVVIGKNGAVKIAAIAASPEIGSLFGDTRVLKGIELKGVSAQPEALAGVLWGRLSGQDLVFDRVHAANVKLALPGVALPDLEITATLGPGGSLERLVAATAEKRLVARIAPQPGRASVEIAAKDLQGTLGLKLSVENFSARAVALPGELQLGQFDGKLLDGILEGRGTLRWGAEWTFEGDVEVRQLDMTRIAPAVFSSGSLEGRGRVYAKARSGEALLGAPRVEGNFVVQRGQLSTVDLARVLQTGASAAGATTFNEVTGQVISGPERVQLRNLRLLAGPLTASGSVDLASSDGISGRVAVEMNTPAGVRRGNLNLSGSISKLQAGR